jgi:hypothetical protein
MNKFTNSLIRSSRKKWLNLDQLEMSIFFFIDSNAKEDIKRVVDNIKLFLSNKNNDIYVIDVADKKNDANIFRDAQYLRVEGGFHPEKLSSLLSDKNIVVGVSSDILLGEGFVDYISCNFCNNKVFLNRKDIGNSILFVASRDMLSVSGFYGDSALKRVMEREIPHDVFDVDDHDFKDRSSLDFKVFNIGGKEVDLYNNKIINGMWIGDALSNVEKLSINSFLKNGHDYNLYVYNDIKGIPDGVVIKDANTIIDSSKIFKYKKMGRRQGEDVGDEGYSGFANWFRYVLLQEQGGWWADMDVVCLKPFNISKPYVFTIAGNRPYINNGIIKTPKNNLMMGYCVSYCREMGKNPEWCETGCLLLERALNVYNLLNFSFNKEMFESLTVKQFGMIFDGTDIKIEECCYSIHLYNSRLSKFHMDKNGVFHKNSLFEKLKRKYLE